MMVNKLAAAILFCLFSITLVKAESTWPQFRGPDGQGRSSESGLPLKWDESTNVRWKTPIKGQGWSSPVVADGKIWLTSATKILVSEAERKARAEGQMLADAIVIAKSIELWAIEVDLATGEVLREVKLADVGDPQQIHSLNSHASPTPVLTKDRLYCHFGDFGTYCLDISSGKVIWNRRIELDHRMGPGSSPFLYKDLLVMTCDGADKQFVTALNRKDGEIRWHTPRPPIRAENPEFQKAYCTPLLISVNGKDQLVIPGAQWCIAYEPLTGKEIWRVDHGSGFSNVPSPVYDGKHVYLCTGYMSEELWAIKPDGQGDVTDTHVKWKQSKQIPTMPSPVIAGENIFTVSDQGIAQSFDVYSGEKHWKKRIGGKYSASPLLAEGRIYYCSHEGKTTVLAASYEYEELAVNKLDGQLMASPVPVESGLLLRTGTHLYRIGK